METLTIMRQAYWQADPREDKKNKEQRHVKAKQQESV